MIFYEIQISAQKKMFQIKFLSYYFLKSLVPEKTYRFSKQPSFFTPNYALWGYCAAKALFCHIMCHMCVSLL